MRAHRRDLVDDGLQRALHAVGKVLVDLLQLVDAELSLGLGGFEILLRRIDFLARFLPLLVLEEVDALLDAVEDGLAGAVRLLAVLLDVEAGLDPLAAVFVDGVFDLFLHLLELGLRLVDRVLDLVDHALGLIDRVLELVDDVLLDRVGGVLERVLRLGDRVLCVLDRALRLVDDVLRARGDGAEDRLAGRVVRAFDGLDHLVQLAAQRLDHRLGHRHGLRGAHLDRALALEDGRLRHRESGLADVERHVGGGDQRLLEALDRAGEIVADGVDRVERRRFHRVERVARVLDGVRRDVGDRSRRLVRLGQGLLRHVGGRGRGLLRRLAV